MPPQKEIDFFSIDEVWDRGMPWYERQFETAAGSQVVGEASPSYSKHHEFPHAAERIHDVLPDVRLIYCIRDPVDRLLSHYRHEVVRGRERRPFVDAVADDQRYRDASLYGHQLHQHLERTDGSRVLVVEAEELRRDRITVMTNIFGFLGVDQYWSGHAAAPELYSSDERLATTGLLRWLAEGQLVKPLRQRLSPTAKRRLRVLARPATSSTSAVDDHDPVFVDDALREVLRTAFAEDQALVQRLRQECR